MNSVRIIASLALSLVAALAMLAGGDLLLSDSSLVDHAIYNSRKIEASFKAAAAYVDSRIQGTGSTPTSEEFEAWSKAQPSEIYGINGMTLDLPPYTSAFIQEHGQPPRNGYAFNYWRGEWAENYVSWTKKSSLTFNRSDYFMFGSAKAEASFFFAMSFLFGVVALMVWPWRKRAALSGTDAA